MRKALAYFFVFLLAAMAIRAVPRVSAYFMKDETDYQSLPGPERVARARAAREKAIRAKFAQTDLPYPPREIFLRWFKKEAVIELWARSKHEPFRLVTSYPILANSGGPGPKRREGDLQTPEGFYEIDRFNPESQFHLSMRVNYPNASDAILSDKEKPGGDIYIHGHRVSIGCGPIGDDGIEELYLIALDTKKHGQQRIPVHIFPAKMSGPEWASFSETAIAGNAELQPFWQQLQPGYDFFESRHLLPKVVVSADGSYKVGAPAPKE